MAANQGISNLWMCSDNLTLIAAINNKTQRKELLGIIKDIHNLSSVFVSIAFFIKLTCLVIVKQNVNPSKLVNVIKLYSYVTLDNHVFL
ncbi:hypothetical protein Bca101_089173 [Brassica carinata]